MTFLEQPKGSKNKNELKDTEAKWKEYLKPTLSTLKEHNNQQSTSSIQSGMPSLLSEPVRNLHHQSSLPNLINPAMPSLLVEQAQQQKQQQQQHLQQHHQQQNFIQNATLANTLNGVAGLSSTITPNLTGMPSLLQIKSDADNILMRNGFRPKSKKSDSRKEHDENESKMNLNNFYANFKKNNQNMDQNDENRK